MDDVGLVEVDEAFACLHMNVSTGLRGKKGGVWFRLTSKQIVAICCSEIVVLLSITSVNAPPSINSITTHSSNVSSCRNASRKLTMFSCLLSLHHDDLVHNQFLPGL